MNLLRSRLARGRRIRGTSGLLIAVLSCRQVDQLNRNGMAAKCTSLLEREITAGLLWSTQSKKDPSDSAANFQVSREVGMLGVHQLQISSLGNGRSILLEAYATSDAARSGALLLYYPSGIKSTQSLNGPESVIDQVFLWPAWLTVSAWSVVQQRREGRKRGNDSTVLLCRRFVLH